MPAEIKRQQLLKKETSAQIKAKKQRKQAAAKAQAQSQTNNKVPTGKSKANSKSSSGILGKIFKSLLLIIVLGLIVVPKPQLLVYKKLGLTATSIYIPGWFGSTGRLLDSPQKVIFEDNLGLVYLCFGEIDPTKQLKEQCNRYQFIEQRGMFAALFYYNEHY